VYTESLLGAGGPFWAERERIPGVSSRNLNQVVSWVPNAGRDKARSHRELGRRGDYTSSPSGYEG